VTNVIVAYDLMSPGQDYRVVERAIGELGVAVKLLNTTWFIQTDKPIAQVRDHINQRLDFNDKLLVVQAQSATGWNINGDSWQALLARWSV